ncbi:S8 family serine peptidase [Lysinibacillus capsici]|uniref:S8 family serine peptidase n=1 Tax=Lysinibacillus capsici TaxID=2115968 RepID=UPI002E1D6653|nr:S8 family serine peptidase [Lysinibacillus capsici]
MDKWIHYQGDGVRIAIIDSGTDTNRNEFNPKNIVNIDLVNNSDPGNNSYDSIGHGTATSFILHNKLPNALIYSVKAFTDSRSTTIEELMAAIKYVINNLEVDIIHLSNGVTFCECIDEFQELCNQIVAQGIIIVAAFDNMGRVSYPAAFDSVIGVDWHEMCNESTKFYYVENSMVNIMGIGSVQRLPWKDNSYNRVAGSSFAAPHITAMISKIIQFGIRKKDAILAELCKNAYKIINFDKRRKVENNWINSIEKAIIFPFNKEIHSLIRFQNELPFKIEGIYEPVGFSKIRRNAEYQSILQDTSIKVGNINQIDWNADFDTLILGHCDVLNSVYNTNFIDFFLEKCLQYSKKIYAFDNISNYCSNPVNFNNCNIYYPYINESHVPKQNMNKLYSISCPVLGVFGTSPRQGKFTMQLSIRKLLQKNSYKVGQLGTEPSALLFGMDEVYPMGYNSTFDITGKDAISVLNDMLYTISNKNPDIILVGSQSQTVPFSTGNIGFYPISQHEFLLGTEPDGIVLCINPNDDIEYIRRTIQYLESYIETKVIALSMFPINKDFEWKMTVENGCKLSESDLQYRKLYFENSLGLPACIIGNELDNHKLVDIIEDYFSSED